MTLPNPVLPLLRAAAFAPLLAACASTQAPPGQPFQLAPHQAIGLGHGLTLTYDSVSDSRCPPDVKCIWAGKLRYRFVLHGPGAGEAFSLGPGQASYAPPALHGGRIVLDESRIPPPQQSQAAHAVPSVTLTIEAR